MIYLNEFDPFAAEWLSMLSFSGQIPLSFVDDRSIADVTPDYLDGFRQCHFFAGIGGWPLAFRLAGIEHLRSAWSGSCPCQPFSSAGEGKGQDDPRHLWPVWFPLIRECQPEYVFGEQVSAAIGHGWLDGVFADMEAAGYTGAAVVLGAHSSGAPHIRQRIWWGFRRNDGLLDANGHGPFAGQSATSTDRYGDSADTAGGGIQHAESHGRDARRAESSGGSIASGCSGLRDTIDQGLQGHAGNVDGGNQPGWIRADSQRSIAASDPWSDYTIGHYRDGKARRIGRSVQPLAHGVPRNMGQGQPELRKLCRSSSQNRTGRLKGYGNAIVPQVAAVFIRAFMETVKQ